MPAEERREQARATKGHGISPPTKTKRDFSLRRLTRSEDRTQKSKRQPAPFEMTRCGGGPKVTVSLRTPNAGLKPGATLGRKRAQHAAPLHRKMRRRARFIVPLQRRKRDGLKGRPYIVGPLAFDDGDFGGFFEFEGQVRVSSEDRIV